MHLAPRNALARDRGIFRAALAVALLAAFTAAAADLPVEQLPLPGLRIDGAPASAHTQGLEIVNGNFYLTARRDDVRPRRALLLKSAPDRLDWEVWDITPAGASGEVSSMDHPGGMQSDGKRLWIPLAESRRQGRSVIRVFPLAGLAKDRRLEPELEFAVQDHIGAVAVSAARNLVLGASWDTEKIYVWDLTGRWQRTLEGIELQKRGLGAVDGPHGRAGLTVQDWKLQGGALYASGLFRIPGETLPPPASRLSRLTHFLKPDFEQRSITLPLQPVRWDGGDGPRTPRGNANAGRDGPRTVELAHEAMALNGRWVYFVPEDLGTTNRVFRVKVSTLLNLPGRAPSSP